MKTKLILIEGLPSSGKSTTAELVHNILNDLKIDNEFFYEGRLDHPADYDGVAFLDEEEFKNIFKSFQDDKEYIEDITIKGEDEYFIEYKKGYKKYKDDISKDFLNEVMKKDIYELPLDRHMELLKKKWKDFAIKASKEEKVYIFDCPFIQNPVTTTMIRDNADRELIVDYIKEIEQIIQGLAPVLIYLDQKDIEASFKRVIEKRPKEWLEFFINYYTNQGYGKEHNLEGLEGTIKVLNARKDIEYDILERLEIESHIVDNSDFDLEKHTKRINDILEVLKV